MPDNPFNTRPKLTADDLRRRFPGIVQLSRVRVLEVQCKAIALDLRDNLCYPHVGLIPSCGGGVIEKKFYKYRL